MRRLLLRVLFVSCALPLSLATTAAAGTIWYSPLTFRSNEPQLTIAQSSPNSTIRITTSTAGDPQWIQLGLTVPDDVAIDSVYVCYETSPPVTAPTYISQIRLNENTTPDLAFVIHDDGTDLPPGGPSCATSGSQ